jgi:uncharacterized membrane protein
MPFFDLLAVAPTLADVNMTPPHKIAWIIHVIGVILWIGGLLFLTRLLGYHMREIGKPDAKIAMAALSRIELRMHHLVIVPGAILAITGGLWQLTQQGHLMKEGWFHAKLTLVLFFIGLHIFSIIHGLAGLGLIAVLCLLRFRF